MMNLETKTVAQLRAYLDKFEDTVKVVVAYPAGDYWRTTLVKPITSIDCATVGFSGYYECSRTLSAEEVENETKEKMVEVLILG